MQTKLLKIFLCTHRKQYSQPCQKVFVKSLKVFCSFLKKIKTPTIFSKNFIFFKGFLSTSRFQFRQSCSKYSDKKLKNFAQKTQLMKKLYIFLKKTFIKMFLGTRRIQFLQQKKLCSLSINDRENFFSKNFTQIISLETKNAVSSTRSKKACRMSDFFPVKVRKRIENLHKFLEIIFHRSVPMDT